MQNNVWTFFLSITLWTRPRAVAMEITKVSKLSQDLNELGIKHLIFTMDSVSLKTFGDSKSVRIAGENKDIMDLIEKNLKKAKRLEEVNDGDGPLDL